MYITTSSLYIKHVVYKYIYNVFDSIYGALLTSLISVVSIVLYWIKAAQEEMASLIKHGTWSLVPRPQGCKPLKTKWVLKTLS